MRLCSNTLTDRKRGRYNITLYVNKGIHMLSKAILLQFLKKVIFLKKNGVDYMETSEGCTPPLAWSMNMSLSPTSSHMSLCHVISPLTVPSQHLVVLRHMFSSFYPSLGPESESQIWTASFKTHSSHFPLTDHSLSNGYLFSPCPIATFPIIFPHELAVLCLHLYCCSE